MNKFYMEGNLGGDFLKIWQADKSKIYVEVGQYCTIQHRLILPIELFIDAVVYGLNRDPDEWLKDCDGDYKKFFGTEITENPDLVDEYKNPAKFRIWCTCGWRGYRRVKLKDVFKARPEEEVITLKKPCPKCGLSTGLWIAYRVY